MVNTDEIVNLKGGNKMKKISNELMENISTYMNDDIREELHFKLAPCSNRTFLKAYCKRDPEFTELLKNEFDIVL